MMPKKKLFCKKCGNLLTLTETNKLGTKINEKTGNQIDRGTDYVFECIKNRGAWTNFWCGKNPCQTIVGYNDVEKKYAEGRFISTDEFL